MSSNSFPPPPDLLQPRVVVRRLGRGEHLGMEKFGGDDGIGPVVVLGRDRLADVEHGAGEARLGAIDQGCCGAERVAEPVRPDRDAEQGFGPNPDKLLSTADQNQTGVAA